MSDFKFEIGDEVSIEASGETGKVRGRCEWDTSENSYYVLYKSADGRAVQDWWGESQLVEGSSSTEEIHY